MEQLSSWDNFFYYGQNPLDEEIQSDLMQLLAQPVKTMFYNRSYGAGITRKENSPNALSLGIGIRSNIVTAIGKRNLNVSSQNPDRRIAASQNSIKINQSGTNLDIQVFYIAFKDLKLSSVMLPLGVSK